MTPEEFDDEGDEPEAAVEETVAEDPAAALRYFRMDNSLAVVDDPIVAEGYLKGGWAEIDAADYERRVSEKEAAKLAAIEAERERARLAELQRLQDLAAIQPPEVTLAQELAGAPAKTLSERMDRVEAILRGQGWPV